MRLKKYLVNCFILLIPIFLWNLFLFDSLPESYGEDVFEQDIPKLITISENLLRVVLFGLPIIMILSLKTRIEKFGLFLFVIGCAIYFLSWLAVINFPESEWSKSGLGFMAPAYTTLLWFIGIGLIGNTSFFKIPRIGLIYICLSVLFVLIHTMHTFIVFQRL